MSDLSSSIDGTLLLVGAGKMGGAMLTRWLQQGFAPGNIIVQDPAPPADVVELLSKYDISYEAAPRLHAPPVMMVVAVKPQLIDDLLPSLKSLASPETLLLSIVAGKTMSRLEALFGKTSAIVRAMPNTPAAIGRGMTVACANPQVTAAHVKQCQALLSAVGELAWIEDESLMDAVTAVSGSGPAYVFLLTEYLAQAGIRAGLEDRLSYQLARQTVSGAGELMQLSDLSPETLRQNVTSPGGTTEAGLDVLMAKGGLKPLMVQAITAAKARSSALSS